MIDASEDCLAVAYSNVTDSFVPFHSSLCFVSLLFFPCFPARGPLFPRLSLQTISCVVFLPVGFLFIRLVVG